LGDGFRDFDGGDGGQREAGEADDGDDDPACSQNERGDAGRLGAADCGCSVKV
jgi:hypothetical protein